MARRLLIPAIVIGTLRLLILALLLAALLIWPAWPTEPIPTHEAMTGWL
jgi:hypothetical protein